MTGAPVFDQVFSEPDGDPETFPGFLLMYHGQQPPAPAPGFPATRLVDQRALAAAYGEATFAAIDPRSAAFRFPDGAEWDFSAAEISPPEVEFWINFQALRDSLKQVFEALDKIWAEAGPAGLMVKE